MNVSDRIFSTTAETETKHLFNMTLPIKLRAFREVGFFETKPRTIAKILLDWITSEKYEGPLFLLCEFLTVGSVPVQEGQVISLNGEKFAVVSAKSKLIASDHYESKFTARTLYDLANTTMDPYQFFVVMTVDVYPPEFKVSGSRIEL